MHRWVLIICCFLPFAVKAQDQFSGSLSAIGIAKNKNASPFWMYANKRGRIDPNTSVMGLARAQYIKELQNHKFSAGAGILVRDAGAEHVFVDQLYGQYNYNNIEVKLGAWHRELVMNDLSSVGGDLLWSGNARALPGIVLSVEDIELTRWLHLEADLGHYFLSKDRFVENAQGHYKKLGFQFDINPRDRFSVEIDHYAQFGGVSKAYGQQPDRFSDYMKIFFGGSGGNEARDTDQANALGNHLGSYTFSYSILRYFFELKIYHQSIFEDTSGMEFKNFPDGVWGLYIQPKDVPFIDAFLYEYVQTVSQSGRFVPPPNGNFRGGDHYFYNGVYQSGWSYKNNIIGLPFVQLGENGIGISSNRFYVHHLGFYGHVKDLEYTFKTSYLKDLGTYRKPLKPIEKSVYSFLGFRYPILSGHIKTDFAFDLSNNTSTKVGLSLGYSYSF